MTFILDFKKFTLKESETTELPEVKEFKDAFENSEWGKILSRDSTIEPKRTGRIYLKTSYLPSKTQIEKKVVTGFTGTVAQEEIMGINICQLRSY